jgi:hypothetical protein
VDETHVNERVMDMPEMAFSLFYPALCHGSIHVLGTGETVCAVYKLVAVLSGVLSWYKNPPLPVEELLRDFGTEVLSAPPPEDVFISAFC